MFTRIIPVTCLLTCALPLLRGQAKYTASRVGDVQAGVQFVAGKGDYAQNLKGAGFYATFDVTQHFGAELDLHQANAPLLSEYERTYEIGARYHRTYGRASPYAKAMIGRGVFNFQNNDANLAYNMFAFGGGLDVRVLPYLNVRADYEFQDWHNFPPTGLHPQLFSVGAAYHFPGTLRRGKHY